MELKEFTKLALLEIVEASKEANAEFGNAAFIGNKKSDGSYWRSDPQSVEFDVAVTSTETDGNTGKGKLTVASLFNIGSEISSQSVNQLVSRVKFTIPLVLQVSSKSIHQEK